MKNIYEYHAKVGTHGSTLLWLFEPAEIGKIILGIDAEMHVSPYMKGHAFRYTYWQTYYISKIYDNGFVFADRC